MRLSISVLYYTKELFNFSNYTIFLKRYGLNIMENRTHFINIKNNFNYECDI